MSNEIESGKVLNTTENYELKVADSEDGQGIYVVVNKDHGVTEASASVLGQALQYLYQIQAGLDMANDSTQEDYTLQMRQAKVDSTTNTDTTVH